MTRFCDNGCLELSFPAAEADASSGIATLSARLTEHGLPQHRAGDVKIALAEAINNVVEHAYSDVAPAAVQVTCCLCKDTLKVLISDTGKPLPGLQPPDGIPSEIGTTIQDLPEGGFGWFLIRELTREIRYRRRRGQNQLTLLFDLRDPR